MEGYRNQQSERVAKILHQYAKENGGPLTNKCFCKSTNITQYLNQFWTWYDNNRTNE